MTRAQARSGELVGAGALVRLGFRRDRLILPVWLYALCALAIVTALAFKQLYPTVPSRLAFAAGVSGNPALVALTGPVFAPTTIGGLSAWRLGSLIGVLIGLMNTFTVIRHGRAEEETGRLELIGACVVGRRAPLAASLVVPLVIDLVVGAVIAVGMIIMGEQVAGSIALGLALALVGACFAGLAAVAAQAVESSRAANGLAGAVVGLAFLLRAIGDAVGATGGGLSWLSWLSPIGWGEQVRAFGDNRWWVLALPLALAVLAIALAHALVARRDLGAGLLATRPGPAQGARSLGNPFALALRLQRGALLGWAAGFTVLGGVFGAIAPDIAKLVNTSPQIKQIIDLMGGTSALVNAFISAMLGLMGMVCSVYLVAALLRMRTEETGQRLEPVLATRTSRIGYLASHLVPVALGSVLLLALAGTMVGLAEGLRTGDVGGVLPGVLAGALVQVPAVWTIAGITVALFGLVPKLASAAWGVIVVFLLVGQLGPALRLPQWAMDVSPFTHVPKLPGGEVTAAPLVWLTVVGVVLAVAGLVGFRRRDIG